MPSFQSDRKRGHKLLPDSIAKAIPALLTHDGKGLDAPIALKLFGPGRLTYLVTEWDGTDELFSYCISSHGPHYDEWGYTSLALLADVSHPQFPAMPAIERDRYFEAGTTVRDVLEGRA